VNGQNFRAHTIVIKTVKMMKGD